MLVARDSPNQAERGGATIRKHAVVAACVATSYHQGKKREKEYVPFSLWFGGWSVVGAADHVIGFM